MKVILTGTDPLFARRFREEGVDVVECPLIRIEPLPGPRANAELYDWILVTSKNAVGLLLDRLDGALPNVAAIGPGTAKALRDRGVEPDLVAAWSTQEGLTIELPKTAGRVLYAGAEGSRDVLIRELDADFLPLYRTVELHPKTFPEGDLVVLASASAARALAAIRPDLPCVTIGPITSAQAETLGLRVLAEAVNPSVGGLLEAVKLARSHASSSPS